MLYKNFSSLVIAGGATKVISSIGVIKFLEEHNMIKSIKNLVGTSAGAVLCAFVALGYDSTSIREFFIRNLCKDQAITSLNIDEMLNFFSSYGVSTGHNIDTFFKRMICQKLGNDKENITFIELAKLCGRNLVICVANLTQERAEFWSVDTKPNMSIVQALHASCAIPILFTPVVIEDNVYLDGGVYNNFPIDYFKNKKLRDVLGINIKAKGYQKTDSLMDYMRFIIYSVMNKLSDKMIEDNRDDNMISLDFEDDEWLCLMDMTITIPKELIDKYIDIGYSRIKEKMSQMFIDFN